jgi:hypothetical protein
MTIHSKSRNTDLSTVNISQLTSHCTIHYTGIKYIKTVEQTDGAYILRPLLSSVKVNRAEVYCTVHSQPVNFVKRITWITYSASSCPPILSSTENHGFLIVAN